MFDPARLLLSAVILFAFCLAITWFIGLALDALLSKVSESTEEAQCTDQ